MRYINFDDTDPVAADQLYMREALKEAIIALEQDEVPVGAIITCQNRIIARSHNLSEQLNDVTAHAEMQSFTAASNFIGGKYLKDCTLYVTLEPCIMCAGAAFWTQIGRIVFGARDPKGGYMRLDRNILHPRTETVSGVLEEECSALLKTFFQKKRSKI